MQENYPENLKINERIKLSSTEFKNSDKLYRSFLPSDMDENKHPRPETISFPDISCNWEKFSIPSDVRFRQNGTQKEGCYSFTVETARYENLATPVHDPIYYPDYPNYSHIEIRTLQKGENILFEPPKNREKKPSKTKRSAYRQNIYNNMNIELEPLI